MLNNNQSILTKLAMIAVANEWINSYNLALSQKGHIDCDDLKKVEKELVWQTCDIELDPNNNDYAHICSEYRPDWEKVSWTVANNSLFKIDSIKDEDQKLMVLDLLDDLFANAYVSVQADFTDRLESGWYYKDFLDDMRILSRETL